MTRALDFTGNCQTRGTAFILRNKMVKDLDKLILLTALDISNVLQCIEHEVTY